MSPARIALLLLLTIAALLHVSPVLLMLAGSFKPDERVLVEAGGWTALWPAGGDWSNYREVFTRVPFARFLLNSLWITAWVVGAGLLVNSLAGYALARLRFPGRRTLLMLVLAVMIVPLEAIAVPLFYQASILGWRDSYSVQILPFVANAFSVYLFYTWFRALPPSLERAAYMDGAGPWRTYFAIVVPNSRPVFAAVAVLTFLTQWGSYLWPLLVTTGEGVRPLPLAVASFFTLPPLQWGDILAFGVMMVAPVMLLFLLFESWFVRGVATAGQKG